jgi:hypothetical protein
MLRSILVALVVALSAGVALAEPLTYRNARFGTTLTFPAEVFSQPMEPPANGDGMTWLSADGASLSAYASNNALMLSPRAFADQASQGNGRFEVTYRRVADRWVVLSGYEDGEIFYYRFEFGADDVIHSMLLRYPTALRERYDPLTGPLGRSLDGP